MLWNAHAGQLWRRFSIYLRREAAKRAGLSQRHFRQHARVSFAKVAEYQKRGAVHFHAVIRLDGPGGGDTPPPAWATAELLTDAIEAAAKVRVDGPVIDGRMHTFAFGRQLDVRTIRSADFDGGQELTERAVAAYIAKYATKGAETATGALDRPLKFAAELAQLDISEHARRLIRTTWTLGARKDLDHLRLRAWAHMLGFRGHFSTKSRRYSTTLGALRDARAEWRRVRAATANGPETETTYVLAHWVFAGTGLSDALPSVETVYQWRRKRTGPRGFRVGRHLRYDPADVRAWVESLREGAARLMAGHIQDRWYRTETCPDGKVRRVKTERHGSGLRYRARYVGPDGTEKSKSFPDRQKRLADQWLAHVEADMARGQYIDPRAARITFQQYAERWVATQGADPNTQASMESQLRLHAFPYLGSRPLGSFQPAHIRDWVRQLQENGVRGSYARTIYSNVRAALSAAVDDGHLPRNPCAARSVRPPTVDNKRVVPWTPERVFAVRAAMPERFQAMVDLGSGCGLRQGEILGVAVDAVDFTSDTLHVVQQLKLSRSKAVFAPPKGGKLRDVPLPGPVADALREHMKRFPPVEITLPWKVADGPPVTKRLIFTGPRGGHVWRTSLNEEVWKRALAAAGVIPKRTPGQPYAESRENGMHALRHFYASVLLDAGENIKALAEYLGHSDPGLTLRVYAHLMPSSQERTRKAIAAVFA